MLDIELGKMLDQMHAAGLPDLSALPPEAARAMLHRMAEMNDLPVAAVGIEEIAIPGPGGPLALRVYRPAAAGTPRGLVLYLHGGGFMLGCARDYEGVCSVLCERSACAVVQVDYRLAPEHPFPAAVDDCYAALCWVAAHAADLGADVARIAVAGDSAGGNLAAVMALLARDRGGPKIAQQSLFYPMVAPAPESFDSYRRYGKGYLLDTAAVWHCFEHYTGGCAPVTDDRLAPLIAADLSGLPPALVLVAGHDVLHDEGVAYADRLAAAGTQVTLVEYPGLAHGFLNLGGVLTASRLAVHQLAAALRAALE